MQPDPKDIQDYKELKKQIRYADFLNMVGFLLLIMSFISLLFKHTYASVFIIGALIIYSHHVLPSKSKQLLRLFEKCVQPEVSPFLKAAKDSQVTQKLDH